MLTENACEGGTNEVNIIYGVGWPYLHTEWSDVVYVQNVNPQPALHPLDAAVPAGKCIKFPGQGTRAESVAGGKPLANHGYPLPLASLSELADFAT